MYASDIQRVLVQEIYIAALVTSSTLLLVCEAKLSLEAYTWCISRGFYVFLLAHPLNILCTGLIQKAEPQLSLSTRAATAFGSS